MAIFNILHFKPWPTELKVNNIKLNVQNEMHESNLCPPDSFHFLFVFRGNQCPRQTCLLLWKRVTNSTRTEVTNKRRKMIWWTLECRRYVRVCLPQQMREADADVHPQQPHFPAAHPVRVNLPLNFTASWLCIAESAAPSAIIQNTGICFQAHIYGQRRM